MRKSPQFCRIRQLHAIRWQPRCNWAGTTDALVRSRPDKPTRVVEGDVSAWSPITTLKLISLLPQPLENGRQLTRSALVPPLAHVPIGLSKAVSMIAFESLCCSPDRSIICMKFTPRHNLIWLARFC